VAGYTLERREARSSDAESIVLWFPTRADVVLWAGTSVPEPLTSTWLAQRFERASYWVWVDETGTVQGVFALNLEEDGSARFGRFALSPGLRGQRLAKGLVQEIITLARSLGAKRLTLGVYGSNRIARCVYEGVGFEVFDERVAEEDPSRLDYQMKLDL
jgi:ribosomal protein S18 acetylase RimI-like enzyme